MPTVLSSSSTPPYWLRFHAPPFSDELAGAMLRAVASSSPMASSAADVMFDVGEAGQQLGPVRSVEVADLEVRAEGVDRRGRELLGDQDDGLGHVRVLSGGTSFGRAAVRAGSSQGHRGVPRRV